MRAGIKCPVDGAEISDDVCLACRTASTPRPERWCDFTYEQLRGMTDDSGRETAGVSSTMLAGPCPRQTWLKTRYPWYLDPNKGYKAYRGTMAHLMLEQYPEKGALYEHRFGLVLPNGREVTGKIDKIHPLHRKKITDAKTKDEDKEPPTKPDPGYVWQLNVYKYLVRYGSPQQDITHDGCGNPLEHPFYAGEPANIEIDELELNYWTMGWVKSINVPLKSDEQILEHMLKGTTVQVSEDIPPVPPMLDPIGRMDKKYKPGVPSTFCSEWCPVRSKCLEFLINEE